MAFTKNDLSGPKSLVFLTLFVKYLKFTILLHELMIFSHNL